MLKFGPQKPDFGLSAAAIVVVIGRVISPQLGNAPRKFLETFWEHWNHRDAPRTKRAHRNHVFNFAQSPFLVLAQLVNGAPQGKKTEKGAFSGASFSALLGS